MGSVGSISVVQEEMRLHSFLGDHREPRDEQLLQRLHGAPFLIPHCPMPPSWGGSGQPGSWYNCTMVPSLEALFCYLQRVGFKAEDFVQNHV